jgi:hypothetical protein
VIMVTTKRILRLYVSCSNYHCGSDNQHQISRLSWSKDKQLERQGTSSSIPGEH